MSFSPDVIMQGLDNTPHTYSEISLLNGKSVRKDASRGLGTPATLTISHEVSGKGTNSIDRHLVRLDLTEKSPDVESVEVAQTSVYTVMTVPRSLIITKSMVRDLIHQLGSFLAEEANVTKLLNGEP
jgi:hypothetical protein